MFIRLHTVATLKMLPPGNWGVGAGCGFPDTLALTEQLGEMQESFAGLWGQQVDS